MTRVDVLKILSFAWSQKIVDFTIVIFNTDTNVTVRDFNPFFNVTCREELSLKTILFPDKLRDANEYPSRLPIANLPLIHMTYSSDSQGDVVNPQYIKFIM